MDSESNQSLNIPVDNLVENDKIFAALAYFFRLIGCALAILLDDTKEKPYIQLHATQALSFHLAFLVINMLTCGAAAFIYIPLSIWHAYRAYQGEVFDIPVITPWLLKSEHIDRVKKLL